MVSSAIDLCRCVAGVRVGITVTATLPVFAASTTLCSRAPRRSTRLTLLGRACATRTPPDRHRECQDDQTDQPRPATRIRLRFGP